MAEIGLIKGLAVNAGYDQAINDLYRLDDMARRSQAIAEAKAKMFADDMDYNNAMNSHDNPIIKEYAKKTISEIGRFVSENPDWMTNVNKRMWVNMKKKELKDNPELLRGVASDKAFEQLNADLAEVAKNPEQYDMDAYNQILAQRDNYLRFGNQAGEDAFNREGKKAFTYSKPRNFVDLSKTIPSYGSQINDFDVVDLGFGGYETKPKESQLNSMVNSIKQEHGRQIQVEANKLGLTTETEVDNWIKDMLMSGVKKEYRPSNKLAYAQMAMQDRHHKDNMALARKKLLTAKGTNTPSYTPWDYFTDEKRNKAGVISNEDFVKVWGNKHPIKLIGAKGKSADFSDFNFNPNGVYVNKGGVTYVPGYIDVPIDIAKERGVYEEPWFGSNDVVDEFSDVAEKIKTVNKDGETVDAVRIKYDLPINRGDKVARQKFNIVVDVDKLVPAIEPPDFEDTGSNVQAATLDEWRGAGWTDAQIQQAVKMGKIKVN